jgi:predicted RNA binding protein YcfA (HicA-like mRNA interferase family)
MWIEASCHRTSFPQSPSVANRSPGFVEVRSGNGSHLLLKHPMSGKEVWVAVHTKKDAGRLGNRILRAAGVERECSIRSSSKQKLAAP